jgi:hypothetical protein
MDRFNLTGTSVLIEIHLAIKARIENRSGWDTGIENRSSLETRTSRSRNPLLQSKSRLMLPEINPTGILAQYRELRQQEALKNDLIQSTAHRDYKI